MSADGQKSNPFMQWFVPGLVIGLIVGMAVGVFVPPLLDRVPVVTREAAAAKPGAGERIERPVERSAPAAEPAPKSPATEQPATDQPAQEKKMKPEAEKKAEEAKQPGH